MADFANEQIEGLKELKKALAAVKDEIKEGIKLQKERVKEIDISKAQAKEMTELAKATKAVAEAEKEYVKVIEQERKVDAQVEKVRQESIKTSQQKLKLTVQEKKEAERLQKIKEKEIKQAKSLDGAYAKQSKKLNDLRKKYKNLRLETGKNSKETRTLQKEIKKLDKTLKDVDGEVGQFQRNVGNYPKAANGAKAAIGSLSGFILGAFVTSLQKSRDVARDTLGWVERLGNGAAVLAQELIIAFNTYIIPSLDNLTLKFQKGAIEAKLFFQELIPEYMRSGEAKKAIKDLNDELGTINDKIKSNKKDIDSYSFSWDELNKRLDATDENIKERLERQDRLIDLTAQLNDEIQKLSIQEEVLEGRIGNSNFSFEQRRIQIELLAGVQKERLDKEEEIARAELKNALLNIENDFIRRDLLDEFNKKQIVSLDFLNDKTKADAVGLANLQELTTATTKLNQIEGERQVNKVENTKETLDNERDLFEQTLDFELDIADRDKSINERRITSGKLSIQEQFKVLAETEKLTEDSYKNQLATTEKFIRDSAKLRGITPEEQVKLDDLDLGALALMNEVEARKALIEAGIADEITQNRIREIIIERKAAVQDLIELEDEVIDNAKEQQMTKQDAEFALRESRKQIAVENADFEKEQRIKDFEEDKKFNKDKLNSAKKSLEEKKKLQKELVIEQKDFEKFRAESSEDAIRIAEEEKQALLEIDREYYQSLEDLDKEAKEKQAKSDAKELEQKSEIFSKLTSALQKELVEQNQLELDNLDKEISDQETGIEVQQKLAEKGLENTLAFEEEQLAKANLKKIEAEKKARQKEELVQLASILGESYIAHLKEGDNTSTALAAATADTFVYREIARGLVNGFAFDGTEDVGDGNGLDSKNGKLWMLHPNERVMSKKQNQLVGDISNDDLANLAYNHRIGIPDENVNSTFVNDNSNVIKAIKSLEETNKNRPFQTVNIDELGNIIETVNKGSIKTITKLKARPRL